MEFQKACNEVYYILENLNPEDKKKIPDIVIKLFKDNQDVFYKVELDPSKPLNEQELMDETKAFLEILKTRYFSTEEEKQEFMNKLNTEIDNIEKEENKIEDLQNNTDEQIVNMTIYRESKLKILLKKILNFFKLKKD